jgi:deoxyribonuclease V
LTDSSASRFCCVDVDYRADCVVAACVGFAHWTDAAPSFEVVAPSRTAAAPYEPGQFYRREMPYLLDVLQRLPALPRVIVVDGFVWLGEGVPGLGARLYEALHHRAGIVGIAKRPYQETHIGVPVLRGESRLPLFVSAAGIGLDDAAGGVAAMHGRYRVPTLIKRVDRLARDYLVTS